MGDLIDLCVYVPWAAFGKLKQLQTPRFGALKLPFSLLDAVADCFDIQKLHPTLQGLTLGQAGRHSLDLGANSDAYGRLALAADRSTSYGPPPPPTPSLSVPPSSRPWCYLLPRPGLLQTAIPEPNTCRGASHQEAWHRRGPHQVRPQARLDAGPGRQIPKP